MTPTDHAEAMASETLQTLRSGELIGNAGPAERVTLTYRAPVYVTVNLKSGDVERVYLDDESVELDHEKRWVNADTDTIHWPSGPEISAVLRIVDEVDWTSTENRCQVWRGAVGGPANTDEIIDVALAEIQDRLAALEAVAPPCAAHDGSLPAVERLPFSAGAVAAVRRFLTDLDVWNAERR